MGRDMARSLKVLASVILGVIGVAVGVQAYRSYQMKELKELKSDSASTRTGEDRKAGHADGEVQGAPEAAAQGAAAADGPFDPCAQGMTMCTMDFRPAACKVVLQGKPFEQPGSNACNARVRLYEDLCEKKITLSQAENESIQCAPTE